MSKTFEDDARFDRLVDGELPAEEYRALVASLDDEPGGWRRCALAFLESQALAEEMSGVRRGMSLSDGGDMPKAPGGEGSASQLRTVLGPFRLTTLLAMAASFLVAFGLGIALPRWFPGVIANRPTVAGLPTQPPITVATNTNQQSDAANQIRHASFKPIGNLKVVVDGPGGDSTPVGDVPMFELPGSMDQWLANERPGLSPEVLQTLEDRGHQVERHIEYVPVQMDDGRQGIVPVERYQIRPSRQPY